MTTFGYVNPEQPDYLHQEIVMTLEIKRVTRKPMDADAVQVTAENLNEVAEWSKGRVITGGIQAHIEFDNPRITNDRLKRAYIGDWVLGMGNHFRVYLDGSYRNTFLEVKTFNEEELLARKEGTISIQALRNLLNFREEPLEEKPRAIPTPKDVFRPGRYR